MTNEPIIAKSIVVHFTEKLFTEKFFSKIMITITIKTPSVTIIFNELKMRKFNVDVGVIVQYDTNEKGNSIRKQLEIDFVCNQGSRRYYIQSAYVIPDQAKMEQEQRSLIIIDMTIMTLLKFRFFWAILCTAE